MVSDNENLWAEYLAARREQYWAARRATLGAEYDSNKQKWDGIIEREWANFSATLRAGHNISDAIKAQMGEDFFLRQLEGIEPMDYDFEKFQVAGRTLTLYTIEDFTMLSNQGIFRDVAFLLDKGRRWEKKAVALMKDYGFQHKGYHKTDDDTYLLMEAQL
ncbi:MAG: hypothetical protein CL833_09950 [Crocinitomicaceae bacterium]|nr:hypothetical protein [Crocinitomicaceae bacterium]